MAKVKIQGHASGTGVVTVTAPNTSTDRTITLPDATGTLLNSDGDGSSLTGVGVDGITSTANATAMTITSSEHIGIGTSSPAITESRQAGKFLTIYSTATNGSILELASNKNTDNDTVGIVSFINTENGDTGGPSRKYLAQIRARVETNDSNAQDDSGGNLVFQTKADGGTIDDRLEITSDGRGLSQFTAKAWMRYDQDHNIVRDSHNVSSVTDHSLGVFTMNFSNNMGNNHYCVQGSGHYGGSTNDMGLIQWSGEGDLTTSSAKFYFMSQINNGTSGALYDAEEAMILIFGD